MTTWVQACGNCGRETDSRVNDQPVCRPCLGRRLGARKPLPPVDEPDLWDDVVARYDAKKVEPHRKLTDYLTGDDEAKP